MKVEVLLQIDSKSNNIERILKQLEVTEKLFVPALSQRVDIFVYANKLAMNANIIYAVVDGKDCGHCAFYVNDEEKYAYITSIGVVSEWQNKGIAKEMLAEVEKCIDYNVKEIRLSVFEDNISARIFYEKQGFDISNKTARWYEMVKRIRR